MSPREQQAADEREIGNLNPTKAYAFIDAVRVAFDVGALGLGVNGNIDRTSSLTTTVTVEGFCSLLALIVAVHEMVNVFGKQCCRRDDLIVQSTSHSATEYSTYIFFRLASVAVSIVGMSLVSSDIANQATTAKSTVGMVALALGIFASRALSGIRHKPAELILRSARNDDGDIEMGLIAHHDDPPPPPQGQPRRVEMEPVPLVANGDAEMRTNQFFQPAPPPAGPAASADTNPAVKRGWKKVPKKR